MRHASKITLTSPFGDSFEIKSFESFSVRQPLKGPATFSLKSTHLEPHIVSMFNVGSKIEAWAGEKDNLEFIFEGVIKETPKGKNGQLLTYEYSGTDWLGKTQNVLVSESFENWYVNDIFSYLIQHHAPFLTLGTIEPTSYQISIRFKDEFLYDCLTKLTDLIDYNVRTDRQAIHFQLAKPKASNIPIRVGDFEKGSASFAVDTSRLVNKLTVYGSELLSSDYFQFVTLDENMSYSLTYQPRVDSTGKVRMWGIDANGIETALVVGAENLQTQNHDVYLNYSERAFRLADGFNKALYKKIKVCYRYAYPLQTVLNDLQSQAEYGIYEDIVRFPEVGNRVDLKDRGQIHLNKYSKPLTVGSLKPFRNNWNAGEEAALVIPDLGLNGDYLQVSEKAIDIAPHQMSIELKFEQKPDLSGVVKGILDRLRDLEKQNREDEIVEKFFSLTDELRVFDAVSFPAREVFIIGEDVMGDAL